MNAVGIDVGKGSSVVCILASDNPEISSKPFSIFHHIDSVEKLAQKIRNLEGPTKIVMESTGVYSLGLATQLKKKGFFVSVVPPLLIKDYHPTTTMRNIKTDKADAFKIADYCKVVFDKLKEYNPQEDLREILKSVHRDRLAIIRCRVDMENLLHSKTEKTFPGVDKLFTSPISSNGTMKWVDFYHTFWHVECITSLSLEKFKERYEKFCKRNKYQYDEFKAERIYDYAQKQFTFFPKNINTKQAIQNLTKCLKNLIKEEKETTDLMIGLASLLPEFRTVIEMSGVGEILGSELIAEIGDVRRFKNRRGIVAFAGIDPQPDDSGQVVKKSVPISRKGSKILRKTLFLVMSALTKTKPESDPVYQFLKKKKDEGKPFKVYMTAGSNKFLRIYYSKVKEALSEIETF